jgi:hypothetical protein
MIDYEYIITIIIVFVVGFLLYIIMNKPSIETRVTYPEHEYVIHKYKKTNYYNSLNQFDLKTRGCLSKEQLLYRVSLSFVTPSEEQKKRIKETCFRADQLLIKKGYSEISKYDWNIVLFSGIENNYPHTHDNMIFLPINFYNVETYIHEKVHIYQRKNRSIMMKEIGGLGFKLLGDDTLLPRHISTRIRHNPDFDNLSIWGNRYIPLELFDSNSRTIADSKLVVYDILDKKIKKEPNEYYTMFKDVNQREHPYEILACRIGKECI